MILGRWVVGSFGRRVVGSLGRWVVGMLSWVKGFREPEMPSTKAQPCHEVLDSSKEAVTAYGMRGGLLLSVPLSPGTLGSAAPYAQSMLARLCTETTDNHRTLRCGRAAPDPSRFPPSSSPLSPPSPPFRASVGKRGREGVLRVITPYVDKMARTGWRAWSPVSRNENEGSFPHAGPKPSSL